MRPRRIRVVPGLALVYPVPYEREGNMGAGTAKDFFVSYNSRDDKWAQWIAWTLEKEGYRVTLQAWDFMSGGNFMLDMHRAATECKRTIGVLSANSLTAPFILQEWAAAMAADPEGRLGKFVPVRIAPCRPDGLLRAVTYIDLVGLPREQAQDCLLSGSTCTSRRRGES